MNDNQKPKVTTLKEIIERQENLLKEIKDTINRYGVKEQTQQYIIDKIQLCINDNIIISGIVTKGNNYENQCKVYEEEIKIHLYTINALKQAIKVLIK